jgi:hypothetical protein
MTKSLCLLMGSIQCQENAFTAIAYGSVIADEARNVFHAVQLPFLLI